MQVTIDEVNLQAHIDQLATYSEVEPPAVTRILFTQQDMQARGFIRQLMKELDLQVDEDAVGNIFGRWTGSKPYLPPVATGSHIDAIPYSGRFDGTVGVLGALEAIRALKAEGFEPTRSIEVIMFTAEEPTRFGVGCLGSRALAGQLTPDDMLALRDDKDKAFDVVRTEAGYDAPLASVQLEEGAYHAFIELHIEQGPRLEQSGNSIGIVTAIAAPATVRVVFHGNGGHAGTVLMPARQDAFLGAAELALTVEHAAKTSPSPDAVATVGLLEVYPGAVNSIPSRVLMEIDIRDIDLESRDSMVQTILGAVEDICAVRQLEAEKTVLNSDAPCYSGQSIIDTLINVSEALGYSYQALVSRAYHDTLFMAQICPTSMIFVPSENGYSHRPDEYTAPEELAKGVGVLALALAQLSSK